MTIALFLLCAVLFFFFFCLVVHFALVLLLSAGSLRFKTTYITPSASTVTGSAGKIKRACMVDVTYTLLNSEVNHW